MADRDVSVSCCERGARSSEPYAQGREDTSVSLWACCERVWITEQCRRLLCGRSRGDQVGKTTFARWGTSRTENSADPPRGNSRNTQQSRHTRSAVIRRVRCCLPVRQPQLGGVKGCAASDREVSSASSAAPATNRPARPSQYQSATTPRTGHPVGPTQTHQPGLGVGVLLNHHHITSIVDQRGFFYQYCTLMVIRDRQSSARSREATCNPNPEPDRDVPRRALAEDPVHQPPRTHQQGN